MMIGKKNIIGDAIKFGLRTLVQQINLFAIVVLVGGIISAAVAYLVYLLNGDFIRAIFEAGALQKVELSKELVRAHIPTLLASVGIVMFVYFGLYLGLNKIALELCSVGKSSVKKLFSCFKLVPRTIVAFLVYFIAFLIGLMLFILPGLFIGIRFSLFAYFIIDQNAGAIESLKMSYNVTRKYAWDLLLLCIVVAIITGAPKMILSFFGPIGWISYLLTIPFTALVYSYFYRSLVPQQNNRLGDAA
jgi:hypothetical protein